MYVYKTRVYLISKRLNLLFNKLIGAYTPVPEKKLLCIAALVVAKQAILSRIVKFPLPLSD